MSLYQGLPPSKRLKAAPAAAVPASQSHAPPPPPAPAHGDDDAVAATASGEDAAAVALARIAKHVRDAAKCGKAAALLCRLLESTEPALNRETHGRAVFDALAAAMGAPERVNAAAHRAAYHDLMSTAQAAAARLLTRKQREQLDCWCLRAVLANEVHTDDSFSFAAVTKRIAEAVSALPDLAAAPNGPAAPPGGGDSTSAAPDVGGGIAPELSPDDRAEAESHARRMAAAEARAAADTARLADERRAAVLSCLEAAHARYGHAWAQTSVDMLVKSAWDRRGAFAPGEERDRLMALWKVTSEAQARRRQGPKGREQRRDETSFDRARAAWALEKVSVRAAVGSEGNADGRGDSCISKMSQA